MKQLVIVAVLALALAGVIGSSTPSLAQSPERVTRISPDGASYVDPEILPNAHLMTYQSSGGVYVAPMNPSSGDFITDRTILMDTGAASGLETFNGPEFGIDANGWALYYAKEDQGSVQIWKATLDSSGTHHTSAVTSGARHQTQLVSRNPRAASTRIVAIEGTWQDGTAVWFDTSDPTTTYPIDRIENGVTPVRWVNNSFLLTYSQRTGDQRGQIGILDTDTNTKTLISNDAGDKTDPYGWYAPEYGDDLLVLAIVDNGAVAVYRDTGRGDYWERIATLYPPPDSRYSFVASAEPFTLDGRSYLSVIVKDATSNREVPTDSEVWLWEVNPNADTRYTERCDSGEVGIVRSDPEVMIGETNVFVYYNVLSGANVTPYEARVCQSHLRVGLPPEPTTASVETDVTPNDDALSPSDNPACQWLDPQATDPAIDIALEPHYVCHDAAVPSRGQLLVFFPGTGAIPAQYTYFVGEAAAQGMHAIGLRYPNALSVNLQICPQQSDADCNELVRQEVITGQDRYPAVEVNAANSITNRLVQAIRYMDTQDPSAGWGQYLDGDTPRWDLIAVAGHSQGAGMAAYIAHEQVVGRAILFAWTDVWRGQVAPWILEPNATSGEVMFAYEHVDDRERGQAMRIEMQEVFGMAAYGTVNVDDMAPPYDGAHVLLTAIEPATTGRQPYSAAHNVVVVDEFVPMVDGQPVLLDVWRYLLVGE